ncbi:DNA ligase [Agrobacterium phage Atu_ph04]|uniref:DNA ligase n=1 Tax=Agrobacterium phage Atu_ph04 TaxID=2024263 RepID=A0A223VZV9_9CAUD|nr:DNA ligase [Agrobacterium phage Atu_ph04]ASV44664.1 DNA ligase [Agrobacterium phage Atu_ph04]
MDIFNNDKNSISKDTFDIISDLNELMNTRGSNAKKDILRRLNPLTKQLFILNMDPFQKFGLSKLRGKSNGNAEGLPWSKIISFLSAGKGRELDKISQMLLPEQFDIVNGVFNGFQAWRTGIKAGNFLSVFPDAFETFEVQLCLPWNPDLFEPGSYAQTKFDGVRCMAAVDHQGKVTFLSRNGKPLENINPLTELELSKFPGYVFDSEADVGDRFQLTAGVSKRRSGSDIKLELRIFDIIPYDAFFAKSHEVPYIDRYTFLKSLVSSNEHLSNCVADHFQVNSADEAEEFYQKQRDLGKEGAIVKKRNGTYNFGRDDRQMKVKPLGIYEVRIVDVLPGSKGSKYENTLGALQVEDEFGVKSRVGSGFSDELRDIFWRDRDDILGELCEIKAMERTESGAFRHSRFYRLRDDKTVLNPLL